MPRIRMRYVVLAALLVPAALVGTTLGYGLQSDLPDVRSLETYTPPLSTRVLARDGSPVGSFGEQRRILLAHKDIPKVFEDALVAVEDSNFYHHSGIDLKGIARAAWHDLTTLSLQQGASTLTQQLARNLFLKPEKTARRKIQEMLLALEIERVYSKDDILRMYCNQVYMGHGRYGVEAAAQFFFGKHARDLKLPEAALLAGLIQRPEGLSPVRYPDRALKRRNHVLARMEEEGYLSAAERQRAERSPLGLDVRRDASEIAPYFVEEVRRFLQARYGDEELYQRGLEVRTTLDLGLQKIANAAVDTGLRTLDKRQGWRGPAGRVPPGERVDAWESPAWRDGVAPGAVTDAVVTSVAAGKAMIRAGPYRGVLDAKSVEWTGRWNPGAMFKTGDLLRVRVVDGGAGREPAFLLEQEPKVEAALVALEPKTGAIRALVGGFDFRRSEFDRALQAKRQAGSSFKPILYAAALLSGRSPSERILDEPTVFVEPGTWKFYQPENYGKKYYGGLTLREALEKSANIASVKLLDEVGYAPVIDLARKLGITTDLQPYPSMALGAFEVTLLEMTSAFGTFDNLGVRVEPYFVEQVLDRERAVIGAAKPAVQEAVPPDTAYQMTRLMEGVITDGTGAAAATLGRPLAGKTGTTDDFADAWFIGYAPDLVVGVWVGFDAKKSLGSRETGAQAALPIWQAFIERAYAGKPPEEFEPPQGITMVAVDRATGLRANAAAGCREVIQEAFVEGTEPTAWCQTALHEQLRFPYPFQRYPVGDDGALEIPSSDLDALLATEGTVRPIEGGTKLEATAPDGPAFLKVRRVEKPSDAVPPEVAEKFDVSAFVGADGRRARIRVLGRTDARPGGAPSSR